MKFHKTSVNFSVLKIFQGKFPYYAGFGFMVMAMLTLFVKTRFSSVTYPKPTYELTI